MPLLSIIIPAYNEEQRLGKTLAETFYYLAAQGYASEIIVVDDGSQDRTVEIAEGFATHTTEKVKLRVLKNPGNRGKGYAVKNGMQHASGEVNLFFDADLATPLDQIPKVMQPILDNQYDVVFGSRALQEAVIQVEQSFLRQLRGRGGNLIIQLLTGMKIKDTQCGFKAFRRQASQTVFPLQQVEGFGFDPEILFIANKQGWRWKEMPVVWRHVEGSKVTMLSASLSVLADVLKIRWNDFLGKYEARKLTEEVSL
ncbi:MAG: dolichyl-phosphate beta-glucosyltransferase [Blastocatellia bacterium]